MTPSRGEVTLQASIDGGYRRRHDDAHDQGCPRGHDGLACEAHVRFPADARRGDSPALQPYLLKFGPTRRVHNRTGYPSAVWPGQEGDGVGDIFGLADALKGLDRLGRGLAFV
jgi:hypothetical protein